MSGQWVHGVFFRQIKFVERIRQINFIWRLVQRVFIVGDNRPDRQNRTNFVLQATYLLAPKLRCFRRTTLLVLDVRISQSTRRITKIFQTSSISQRCCGIQGIPPPA